MNKTDTLFNLAGETEAMNGSYRVNKRGNGSDKVLLYFVIFILLIIYPLLSYVIPETAPQNISYNINYNGTNRNFLIANNSEIRSLFGVNYKEQRLSDVITNNNSEMCQNILPVLWNSTHPLDYTRKVQLETNCIQNYYLGLNYFISTCGERIDPYTNQKKGIGIVLNQYRIAPNNIFYGSINRIELSWEQFCSLQAISNQLIEDMDKISFNKKTFFFK